MLAKQDFALEASSSRASISQPSPMPPAKRLSSASINPIQLSLFPTTACASSPNAPKSPGSPSTSTRKASLMRQPSQKKSLECGSSATAVAVAAASACSLSLLAKLPGVEKHCETNANGSSHFANSFLDNLRSSSLLEYDFMRNLTASKQKHKPVALQTNSRTTATYDLRKTRLDLEQQVQQFHCQSVHRTEIHQDPKHQHHPQQPPKAIEGQKSQRRSSMTSPLKQTASYHHGRRSSHVMVYRSPRVTSTGIQGTDLESPQRSPPSISVSGIVSSKSSMKLNPATGAESSACEYDHENFPTLWQTAALSTSIYRDPSTSTQTESASSTTLPSTAGSPRSSTDSCTSSSSTTPRSNHKGHEISPKSRIFMSSELDEFQLRKCHPTSVVVAEHGFLQDQDLHRLMQTTGYDRAQLYALWTRYKALCSISTNPKGVDRDTFCRGIPQLSVEDAFFVDRVFQIIDTKENNCLQWHEFVHAMSAIEQADVYKRIKFLFRVYDLHGTGQDILRHEIVEFFLSSLLVSRTTDVVEVAKQFVDHMFESMGCGERDSIRLEDAAQFIEQHPEADIFTLFGRTLITASTANGSSTSVDGEDTAEVHQAEEIEGEEEQEEEQEEVHAYDEVRDDP